MYCGTEEGRKKSKLYNEYVIVSLIDYSIDIMHKRNDLPFKNEIQKFYQANAYSIYQRYHDFLVISMKWNLNSNKIKETNGPKLSDLEIEKKFNEMIDEEYPTFSKPSFLLLPASDGKFNIFHHHQKNILQQQIFGLELIYRKFLLEIIFH